MSLNNVFDLFQKEHNILALFNHECCQTCGHTSATKLMEEGNFNGYIFFHSQDADGAIEQIQNEKNTLSLYISYDSIETADKVVEIFNKNKIDVDWNNNSNTRMKIIFSRELFHLTRKCYSCNGEGEYECEDCENLCECDLTCGECNGIGEVTY